MRRGGISQSLVRSWVVAFDRHIGWGLQFLALIATTITLGWLLWICGRGFDFTDESLYLVWLHSPYQYPASITQFGFVYRPLDWLVGGDIALLRRANVLLTFGLAWAATYLFLSRVWGNHPGKLSQLTISAIFAVSNLIFFQLWLPAPSYNSLTLQSLFVTLSGLLLADRRRSRSADVGWFAIALGGWLAFMAKPTTAVAVGVLCAIYLLLMRRVSLRGIAISTLSVAALLVAGAFFTDGSISGFVHRIQAGLELGQALGAGHDVGTMLRIDPIVLPEALIEAILTGGLAVTAVGLLLASSGWFLQALGALGVLAMLVYAAGLILGHFPARQFGMFQGMMMLAAPLAGLGFFVVRGLSNGLHAPRAEQLGLMLLCALFPFAYTFGTNNNYWVGTASAAYFWLLVGVALWCFGKPDQSSRVSLVSLAAVGLTVTATLMQLATQVPYRQLEALQKNDSPTKLGPDQESSLLLSRADSQYIQGFIRVVSAAGFRAGMPMIDLTGRSPGLLYAGGARNVGQPWLIGGYPGSSRFVSMALDAVPCDVLASSWLLVEADSPRALPQAILSRYGMDTARDYLPVGEIVRSVEKDHADEARRQLVFKPVREPAMATQACQAARTIFVDKAG